jgi:hypothetical protein
MKFNNEQQNQGQEQHIIGESAEFPTARIKPNSSKNQDHQTTEK